MNRLKLRTSFLIGLLVLSAAVFGCGGNTNVIVNTNTPNKAATAEPAKTQPPTTPAIATPASKAASSPAAADSDAGESITGELQVGRTESLILYVGKETGDYAAYCFANDSEPGRAIMAVCKDKQPCGVIGTIDGEGSCRVPGLEADLSASGRITKVNSAKVGKR